MMHRKRFGRERAQVRRQMFDLVQLDEVDDTVETEAQGDEAELTRPKLVEETLPDGSTFVAEWLFGKLLLVLNGTKRIELNGDTMTDGVPVDRGAARITYMPGAVECRTMDCEGPFRPYWSVEFYPHRPHSPEWIAHLFPDGTVYYVWVEETWAELPDEDGGDEVDDEESVEAYSEQGY